MAESIETFNEIDQIRREVKRLRDDVADLRGDVQGVDRKVDVLGQTQTGALALAAAAAPETDMPREVMLQGAGLSNERIAQILGKKPDAVRMFLRRWHEKNR